VKRFAAGCRAVGQLEFIHKMDARGRMCAVIDESRWTLAGRSAGRKAGGDCIAVAGLLGYSSRSNSSSSSSSSSN